MLTRRLFQIGLTLIAISICSVFIIIILLNLPERSSNTIPLTGLPYCQGGCGGGGINTIGGSPLGWITVASEWPTQMDIDSSDNITVLLTTSRIQGKNTLSKIDNHEIAKGSPFLPEAQDRTIDDAFGPGYNVVAIAHLVSTSFNVQSLGPAEQSIDQSSIEWDWNINPKILGTQVIMLDIEVRWNPKNGSNEGNIERQIWLDRHIIRVDEPFIVLGQVPVGAIVTGFVAFLSGVGLSVPWLSEKIENMLKTRKSLKKEKIKPIKRSQPRIEKLIREQIEKKGRKRQRRRKPGQQTKNNNTGSPIKLSLRGITFPITWKKRKTIQRQISRRTVVRGLIWTSIGMVSAGIGLSLISSFLGSIPLGKLFFTFKPGGGDIAWSPDNKYLISTNDGGADVWDVKSGKRIKTYKIQNLISAAWSPDSNYLSFLIEGKVQVQETATGHLIFNLHDQFINLAWSPNGKQIALAGGGNKTVQVWDITNIRHVCTYGGHTDFVDGVTWSADGQLIASGSYDGTVQMWNARNGNNTFTYNGHSYREVTSVAWSPNGQYVASTGLDDTIQVWSAENGDNLFTYYSDMVGQAIAWSPDSRLLAFGGQNGTEDQGVQIWDVTNERKIFTYHGNGFDVFYVVWSPNGRYIASSGSDNTIQIWSAG